MSRTLLLSLGSCLALCACGNGAPASSTSDVTLRVEAQDWTGWQREQPEPKLTTIPVSDDSTFEVATPSRTVTFTVTGLGRDEVDLETDQKLVVDNGDGIDLDAGETDFTVHRDKALTLTTPTMDAGTSITLTIG